MASPIGSLFVNLGINTAKFGAGLGKAERRLKAFGVSAGIAAGVIAGALTFATVRLTKAGLATVDSQAKLAQSLNTSTKSIQIMGRAGELAGVDLTKMNRALKDMVVKVSQAAGGTGPAVDALDRLQLSASDLLSLPIDQQVGKINAALEEFVPAAERAGVASQIFGETGWLAATRIDSSTIAIATQDIEDFGIAVTDVEADQIERTNDALSRLGLISKGIAAQMAAAFAPALESLADGLAAVWRVIVGPLKSGIETLGENLIRLATYAATAAAWFGGKLLISLVGAAAATISLSGAMVFLRGALIRTGFGALIVGAGELVFQFLKLVKGAGGFGNAMSLMKDVAIEVWDRVKSGGDSLAQGLGYTFDTIRAGWLSMLASMQQKWADFLHATAGTLRDVPGMEDAWISLGNAAIEAGSKYYDLSTAARDATMAAAEHAVASVDAATAMRAPLESLAALRSAMAGTSDETDEATSAADRYNAALAELGGTIDPSGGGGGAGGAGGVAGALDALKQKAASVFEATRTPVEKLKSTLAELRQMLNLGLIDWETFGRAAQQAAVDAGAALRPLIEDIRDSLSSSLGGAISGLIEGTKTLKEGLADVFQQLYQMALNRLIQQFLTSLLGGFGGLNIPGFASGTNSAPGGVALVGERGPELVNLPKGSQVIPNHELTGGAPSIFNIYDPSIVGDYLSRPEGKAAILNIMQSNRRVLSA